MTVRVQRDDFDLGAEVKRLTAGRIDVGAVATFTGLCRGVTGDATIGAMTLETYEAMAIAELERIEAEARQRWPLQDVLIVHRHGRLPSGSSRKRKARAAGSRRRMSTTRRRTAGRRPADDGRYASGAP